MTKQQRRGRDDQQTVQRHRQERHAKSRRIAKIDRRNLGRELKWAW